MPRNSPTHSRAKVYISTRGALNIILNKRPGRSGNNCAARSLFRRGAPNRHHWAPLKIWTASAGLIARRKANAATILNAAAEY